MKIDRKLNIVIPIDQDGRTIYVHSAPIGRAVFENYFMEIGKTFAAVHGQGLGLLAGPRIAAHLLRKISTEAGTWEGSAGVERGLVAEIRRLTNVVMPEGNGWATVPFQEVVDRNLLGADDTDEVENALVFFMVSSAMHRRKDLAAAMEIASSVWGLRTEYSNCTDFASSLPTSTPTANTGARVTASSIPH